MDIKRKDNRMDNRVTKKINGTNITYKKEDCEKLKNIFNVSMESEIKKITKNTSNKNNNLK